MSADPARLRVAREKGPTPPRHLAAAGRRLWRRVAASYALEGHHEAVLSAACEALDRMRQAQAAIDQDGITVEGRFGPRAHPAIAIERDSRLAVLRALRELGLDYSEAPSRQRTEAAREARWR
jgi:P27 family predicted phage terminase small subunit